MRLPEQPPVIECDLLVVGSGAGALAAAATASILGLHVVVAEKEACFGGATARSGGWIWVPGNAARPPGDTEAARTYIKGRAGPHYREDRVEAFLAAAPKMVEFFESHTALRFRSIPGFYDYSSEDPGATDGRGMITEPYDADELGPLLDRIRPPLTVATFLGVMVELREQAVFMKAGRSAAAAFYVVRRLAGHFVRLAVTGRRARIANGAALVGRLLRGAEEHGAKLLSGAHARSLISGPEGAIIGAEVFVDGRATQILARRGVVLATGGFNHDPARRDTLVPWTAGQPEAWALFPPGNTGDGLRMAEKVGGVVSADLSSPVAMGPLTPFDHPIGNSPCFPQLSGRGKPGLIAVLRNGRRFCDEALSYHHFTKALLEAYGNQPGAEAFLICDRTSYRRYGLGFAKPWPLPSGRYERLGYLKKGKTIVELAEACGIDPAGLSETIVAFNLHARDGNDPEFGRGSSRYERAMGDADLGPNPCVSPLDKGPFYAVRVIPGALGTFAGLVTDGRARVLDDRQKPVPNLYAAGNDAMSLFGGDYIAGGITLGPAMTLGFLAGMDAAGMQP